MYGVRHGRSSAIYYSTSTATIARGNIDQESSQVQSNPDARIHALAGRRDPLTGAVADGRIVPSLAG